MNFVRLNKSTYFPEFLIEGYTSLIWTERYDTHGDFVLKTYDINYTMEQLPENCFVSHVDTRVVMEVESHVIEEEGEGQDVVEVLTVTGRAVTHILESRWVESNYQKKRKMRKKYPAYGALAVLLVNAIDNRSGKDITRGDPDPFTDYMSGPNDEPPVIPEQNDFSWNTLDYLPNVAVTDSTSVTGTPRWWKLEQGILYPQFQKILQQGDLGFRALRPKPPSPGKVVTVKTNLEERGEIVRTQKDDVVPLAFDIYDGLDRSATVKFSDLQGHLDKSVIVKSVKDYKTIVEVISGTVPIPDISRPNQAGLSGWDRRVSFSDAGEPEIPDAPEKPAELKDNATQAQRERRRKQMDRWIDAMAKWRNKRNAIVNDFEQESKEEARKVLKSSRKIRMLSAEVSELSPHIYGKHYNLGDTVTLNGNHGFSTKMVVSEFVRTEDVNGERGLPGLVEP